MNNLPADYREEEAHVLECEISESTDCICLETLEAHIDRETNNRVKEEMETI